MFTFTSKQQDARKLLSKSQKHTLLVGGARSGKTTIIVDRTLIRAIKAPGSRHVIFKLHGNSARASISLDTLPKVAKWRSQEWGSGNLLKEHRNDGFFEVIPTGSEIWVAGLDDKERVDKILGMEFATIDFNECSQIPYSSVTTALTRLAQKVTDINGKLLKPRANYDLNPVSTAHWTYKLFIEGLDPVTNKPLSEEVRKDYAWMKINPEDNEENLPEGFIETTLMALPERQRLRFLSGEYCAEVNGALWSIENLEAGRVDFAPPLKRIVISIDPSGHNGDENSNNDAIGINASGLGYDNHIYVLEDLTCELSPEGWSRLAVKAYKDYHADMIIAEGNFGGDMVRSVIRSADPYVPIKLVRASRGKKQRAEPAAALYEPTQVNGEKVIRVHHVGDPDRFRFLEEELLLFSTSGYQGARSPNRADACIWNITELLLDDMPISWQQTALVI